MMVFRFNYLIGFCIPLPIYIDPKSPVLLAVSILGEENLAVPLSLFFLPAVFIHFIYFQDLKVRSSAFLLMLCGVLFSSWVLFLGLYSSSTSFLSIAYSVQWVLPFLWLPYFFFIFKKGVNSAFIRGFATGVLFAIGYIFCSGVLEIIVYGGLLDSGRMSQNKVFIGQYQLYVYAPTMLAYGANTYNWLWLSGYVKRSSRALVVINLLAFTALMFLGSREGILVYILGVIIFYGLNNIKRLSVMLIALLAVVIIVSLNLNELRKLEATHSIRSLDKFFSLLEEGKVYGARDDMVKQYLKVIDKDVVFGTRMLPVNKVYPELLITSPSAHNYYVDVLAWGGIFSAVFMYAFITILLLKSFSIIIRSLLKKTSLSRQSMASIIKVGAASSVMLFFVISNNINVPMRQPITAPLIAMLITLLYVKDASFERN